MSSNGQVGEGPQDGVVDVEVELGSSSGSEAESLNEISDSEIDLDVDSKEEGKLGELADQARLARSELQGMEESEEESEGEEKPVQWGSRKEYYGTNERDAKDADREGDIEEALAIQRSQLEEMRDTDFQLPSAQDANQGNLDNQDPINGEEFDLEKLREDLKVSLEEVNHRIGPLLEEARKGDLCTDKGLAYLETKHQLLLHYSMCIVFYVLLKLEGKSVKDHPVLLRLIEIKAYLEKMRPMEARLQPQLDKLLRAAEMAENDVSLDGDVLAPRPEDLVPKTSEKETYVPPKIAPVAMKEDRPKKKRSAKDINRDNLKDSMMSEIVREMTDAPEEIGGNDGRLEKVRRILIERKAAEWSDQEEDAFALSQRETTKRLGEDKEINVAGMTLEDFADDIEKTVDAIQSSRPLPAETEERPRPKSKIKRGRPPLAMKTTTGKRAITSEIQKNRGLTPYRSKDRKNPRKRHRSRFEKYEVRRKGQVHSVHSEAPDHYGGEPSGISKKVKKSVKFK